MSGSNWTRAEICEAAMRPALGGRRFWLWVGLLALPVLAGVGAYLFQLTRGLGVTGLNQQFFWGTYETNLVTFIGYSYGGALVSAILRLTGARWRAPITRIAEAMALVTLLVGASFALIHLGRPERVWQFLVTPRASSPLVWDFVAINTYLLATLVFLYLPLIPDLAVAAEWMGSKGGWLQRFYRRLSGGWLGLPEQHQLLDRALLLISMMIIPVAIMVHSVLAWAFSLNARDGWHSSIFGPYFVVGALFSGVAMVIAVMSAFRRIYRLERFIGLQQFQYLGYLLVSLGLLYLYFTFTDLLSESFWLKGGSEHLLTALLSTHYAPLFWGVIGVGILTPILLIAWPQTRTVSGITTAAVLVVLTMWIKRFLIVVPALAVSSVEEHLPAVLYIPSWVELSVTLAAVFAIPLLLALFFRVFPVLSIAELEEAADAQAHALPPAHAGGPLAQVAAGKGRD